MILEDPDNTVTHVDTDLHTTIMFSILILSPMAHENVSRTTDPKKRKVWSLMLFITVVVYCVLFISKYVQVYDNMTKFIIRYACSLV